MAKATSMMPVVQCEGCQALFIPPVYVCRKCESTRFVETEVDGKGVVYTHTTIRVAPEALRDQVPYTILIVELSPELRVTARLEKPQDSSLRVGQPVRFTRVDEQGYWFEAGA